MDIRNVSFPVFKLSAGKPIEESNVLFYLYGKDLKYSDAEYKILIVDDKNVDKPTLSLRRLYLRSQKRSLYKLNKAIFFLSDLIKLANKGTWFIDQNGTIFEYEKTKKVPLVYKPIVNLIRLPSGGAIIEVEGIPYRFKSLFYPQQPVTHAGLLYNDNSYILYGLYDKEYKKSTRLI